MTQEEIINEMCIAALVASGAPEKEARDIIQKPQKNAVLIEIKLNVLRDMSAAYMALKKMGVVKS
jgi:hypothetical protein